MKKNKNEKVELNSKQPNDIDLTYVVSEDVAKKYQNNDVENVPEKKSKDNVCSKCSSKIKKSSWNFCPECGCGLKRTKTEINYIESVYVEHNGKKYMTQNYIMGLDKFFELHKNRLIYLKTDSIGKDTIRAVVIN
jgi:hypothetical protein